jgi:hypothetical protein
MAHLRGQSRELDDAPQVERLYRLEKLHIRRPRHSNIP